MTTGTPFRGLSAFPLTPADERGRVDTETLARLVKRLCEAGVDSIGLLGSTGIYAYLSREERRRAVEAASECGRGRVPLVVGVGTLRTDHAMDLARDAEAAGADALLMAPVSYTPLTQDEAYEHYHAVTGASGLPLCIYNNPGTTHFTFGIDLLARLSRLPTIRAVKMPLPPGGDFAGELASLRGRTQLAVGYSGDWGTADAMLAGCMRFSMLPDLGEPNHLVRSSHSKQRRASKCWPRWNPFWPPSPLRSAAYGPEGRCRDTSSRSGSENGCFRSQAA